MLDFTYDDNFLLSGSADETVMIWSLESLKNQYHDEERELEVKGSRDANYEPDSLGLGPAFDVKFIGSKARLVAPDDINCIQVILIFSTD